MTNAERRMLLDDDGPAGAPPRLLLVDDDPPMLHALAQFLIQEGYPVDTAADGAQAVELLATNHYHLVFTEVRPYLAEGANLLRTIRQQHPKLPVLVIADYATMARAEEAVELGAFEYLVRPIIDDEIRTMIQRALRPPSPPPNIDLLRRQRGLQMSLAHGPRWWRRRQTCLLRQPPGMA